MNTLKRYVRCGLFIVIAAFVLGLSGNAQALAPESPGAESCELQTLIQLAAGDENKDEDYTVKKSGGTWKNEGCPRQCTREVRYCTEWLTDGKCKLWASKTEYYCCP